MPEFQPTGGGGVRLLLDDAETAVLRQIATEMRAVLTGKHRKNDPVAERLFPSAYEDGREEKAYRELIGDDLVRQKVEALDLLEGSLGEHSSEITLEGESFHVWLACLNDMRLAIGTRLGVDEEQMARELDPDDPGYGPLAILHWLGWIQESLLQTNAAL